MQFFIDECISPQIAARLNESGHHSAVHPRDIGRRGDPDHVVLRNAIAEDRIIVTENARDFRGLVGKEELHPGLIILCLLYTSPSPRDGLLSRMPSSA